jgi:hypothetical protein
MSAAMAGVIIYTCAKYLPCSPSNFAPTIQAAERIIKRTKYIARDFCFMIAPFLRVMEFTYVHWKHEAVKAAKKAQNPLIGSR